MAMQAKLRIDGEAIGGPEAQFYYVYSSLGAKVQGLVLTFVRAAQKNQDWEPLTLLNYLERIYDDPNKVKKAGQRLIELRQGTSAIATYIPQYERLLFEAGADSWPDDAKITTLVGGLNKYTRQQVDRQMLLPTIYNEFIRMLQTLGNQFGHTYDGAARHNGNEHTMEWEPVKVAMVAPATSREQRQTWRENGKCVRCGSSKHWASACKKESTRSRSSSTSSEGSGINIGTVAIGRGTAIVPERPNSSRTEGVIGTNGVMTSRTKTTARSAQLDKLNKTKDTEVPTTWMYGP